MKKRIEELKDKEMYCLCAPNGSTQLMTLAPDFVMCCAIVELLASHGIAQPLAVMFKKGYTVMPVQVTILQNGDENKPFNKK